jgi:hypothetical protein
MVIPANTPALVLAFIVAIPPRRTQVALGDRGNVECLDSYEIIPRAQSCDCSGSPRLLHHCRANGAGKTTFAKEFLPYYAGCTNFINPDLIAQALSPFDPDAATLSAGRKVNP